MAKSLITPPSRRNCETMSRYKKGTPVSGLGDCNIFSVLLALIIKKENLTMSKVPNNLTQSKEYDNQERKKSVPYWCVTLSALIPALIAYSNMSLYHRSICSLLNGDRRAIQTWTPRNWYVFEVMRSLYNIKPFWHNYTLQNFYCAYKRCVSCHNETVATLTSLGNLWSVRRS